MADNIIIEALFAPGCESRDDTLLMIDKVTNSRGITVALKEITVGSIQKATQARFLGSPSVRVNGQDIEAEPAGKADYGVG
jgi:hypothetical protein